MYILFAEVTLCPAGWVVARETGKSCTREQLAERNIY